MDKKTISFIKMRFRFIFLKEYIFAICSEELLALLHYRLVILNTTIFECLLKGNSIKLFIENSYEKQEGFADFLTEMLSLIKLSSNTMTCNFPQYILDNNLLDTIIKNIQLVLHIEDSLYSPNESIENSSNLDEKSNKKEDESKVFDEIKYLSILSKDVNVYED